MIERTKNKFNAINEKYGRYFPVAFFVFGFIFDIVAIQRVDDFFGIVQQALYLVVTALVIATELVETQKEVVPPRGLAKFWPHRELLLQFLFGSLLNVYTIFYFKSASAFTSIAFILVMVVIITANEFKKFGKYQTHVHVGILSLCLISFLGIVCPIVIGYIGLIPFLCANLIAWCLMVLYQRWLKPKMQVNLSVMRSHVLIPFATVQTVFVLLYILRVLPPVPLSASYMGIYHDVQKASGEYALTYTRPDHLFWQRGDQTFYARPGDTIYCFVRIFAPARFKDELQVRWLFKDPKHGWQSHDAIPLPIVGGRDAGYRGVTKKSNYKPGVWRVQVETTDGREVGRINFEVIKDDSTEPRDVKVSIQ